MKKAVVFVVLVMVLAGSCVAQSAGNDAQRIVGTWVSNEDQTQITWVFNANGTGTGSGGGRTETFDYGISAGGKIYISLSSQYCGDLYMSPDGKRMIINGQVFQKK